MSKQFLVLVSFCLVFTTFVFAQQKTSGVIYYTQVIDTRAMRQGAEGQQQQSPRPNGFTMPDKITNKMEIIYNANGAKLQKSQVEEDISQAGNAEGGMRMMRFGGNADREVFFKAGDKKVTESFEMNDEPLLLEKQLGSNSTDVVKSDETRKIAGFDCKKVIIKDKNGSETAVWYTTDLAFTASPVPALWTEGVVLGLENQRMKYYASSIEYIKIKDSELALPKKARLITEEEYQAKQAEFRKRMQEQFRNRGGNGNQVIIREGGN
ncbi:GLPGLI family protein [Flavihumibacter sp. R14]|nr:GLPGLI family protein [Flavihumibacter soli]